MREAYTIRLPPVGERLEALALSPFDACRWVKLDRRLSSSDRSSFTLYSVKLYSYPFSFCLMLSSSWQHALCVADFVLELLTLEALAAWVTGNPTCGCLPCILTQGSGGAFIPSNSIPLPEGGYEACMSIYTYIDEVRMLVQNPAHLFAGIEFGTPSGSVFRV